MQTGLPPAEGASRPGTPVVVADVGAAGSRFGPSGAPAPALELAHGPGPAPADLCKRSDGCGVGELQRPYSYSESHGLELDADALEACLRLGLSRLDVPSAAGAAETSEARGACPPVLLVEPTQASVALRRSLAEVLFEGLQAPRAFLGRRAAMSTYAHGQTTAVVLDLGASHACAAVVLNGWVVPERVRDTMAGGDLLDRALFAQLRSSAEEVRAAGSAAEALRFSTSRALKEAACRLGGPAPGEDGAEGAEGPAPLLLPDGARVELHGRREALHELPERLFFAPGEPGPELPLQLLRVRKPLCKGEAAAPVPYAGLHALLAECAAIGDAEGGAPVPKQFGRSVVLVGGCARLAGLHERLQGALGQVKGRLQRARLDWRPTEGKPRGSGVLLAEATATNGAEVAAARELGHGAWTGGSILASLGCFEDFWVTRAEYEEVGAGVLARKCP